MYLTNTSLTSYTSQSVVSKAYVDLVSQGLNPQAECQCATTTNLSDINNASSNGPFSTTTTTIDGYTLQDQNRVLVKNQTTSAQNGTYVYNYNSGSPYFQRATEAQVGTDIAGYSYYILNGTVNGSTTFVETTDPAIIGTDNITFAVFGTSTDAGIGLYSTQGSNSSILNVDSSLNFINYLDNTGGPNPGTINIGTYTSNISIGSNSLPTTTTIGGNLNSVNNAIINGVTVGRGIDNSFPVGTNTIFGYNAMQNLSSNTYSNTAIGYAALQSDTTGANNTAVGAACLQDNTTGVNNTGVGSGTLQDNTTGNNNTGVGQQALFQNTTGNGNTSVGYLSLYNETTGNYNTALGNQSLGLNTVGINNSALGSGAGYNDISGNYNTYLGTNTGQSVIGPIYQYSTAIGANAVTTSSNQMMLGGNNGSNVYPQVVAPGGMTGATGSFTYLSATQGLIGNSTGLAGGSAFQIPYQSAPSNTLFITAPSSSNQILNYDGTSISWIGLVGLTGSSKWNSNGNNIYNNNSGNVGIGTTTPLFNLDVSGNLRATGGITGPTGSFTYLNSVNNAIINGVTVGRGTDNSFPVGTNTIFGYNAMQNLSSNTYSNTAIGYAALQSDTTGANNTAVGAACLQDNTTGVNNTGVGSGTLQDNTTGNNNTGVGQQALFQNTTGNGNTSVGYLSLYNETTGNYNTALGNQSLGLNTVGINNSALGSGAGYNDISGNYNTYLGTNTGQSVIGPIYQYSTAIGANAVTTSSNQMMLGGNNGSNVYPQVVAPGGMTGATGSFTYLSATQDALINTLLVGLGGGSNPYNTAVGYSALESNTINGKENTAIGYNSLRSNTTGYNNVAVGVAALQTCSIAEFNTGIGKSSLQNTSGANNTALGNDSGQSDGNGGISGQYNTFLGCYADVSSNSVGLGQGTPSASYTNSTALGTCAIIDASNQIVLGGTNTGSHPIPYFPYPNIKIPGSYVGINGVYRPINSGNYTLDVSGNIYASGTITSSSDYRIKENVTPLNDTYVVDELIPVTYTNKITARQDMGLIAHELQEVFPFLVIGEKDGQEYQSVNYTGLIPLLIKEVKWLKNELSQLKQQINKLNK